MAKLNLKDFIELTGKTSITDWVKYNWLGVPYGPGPEPEPVETYMSITGHPYSADVGSLVKSLLQVTVVYDDGSSRELDQDEYQTNWALIDEGPNEIIVTYKEFTDTCTIIGLQPQPVSELIFNALPYDVGTIDAPVTYNDYITIEGASGTFNINAKDPAYSYQGMDYDKVFRMASGTFAVTVIITPGEYRYLDVIAAATSNRTVYINGNPVGLIPRNEGAVNAVNNFDIFGFEQVAITVSGGTDLVEIRLRPEEGPEPEPVEPAILNADDFDTGTTTGNYGSFTFPGSQEVRSRARMWTDPDDESITKEWIHSFKRPVIDADATGYNKLILWMSNGSSSAVSRINIYNDDETYTETFDTLLSSADVIKIEATIPEGIYHISWSTGTPDIHEIQLIKE